MEKIDEIKDAVEDKVVKIELNKYKLKKYLKYAGIGVLSAGIAVVAGYAIYRGYSAAQVEELLVDGVAEAAPEIAESAAQAL